MLLPGHIIVDPEVLAGKPVVRGTRLAVGFILELIAAGETEKEILANYPGLTREDILACLSYASYLAHEYKAYPIPALPGSGVDANSRKRELPEAASRGASPSPSVSSRAFGSSKEVLVGSSPTSTFTTSVYSTR